MSAERDTGNLPRNTEPLADSEGDGQAVVESKEPIEGPQAPVAPESFVSHGDSESPHYVVGIGASAGGLEALERFFEKMPTRTGLAFVVIQHLSPDFKSLMDELLARRTAIPVVLAQDGMQVEADRIHLMPARNQMIISGGRLLLSDKEPDEVLSLPIDQFFRSLAQDAGREAIGIILSGTGSDGSRGVRSIHEAGGLVLAQSEETAKFNGMPKSALETGVVDQVLPPESMPSALLRHISHPAAEDAEPPAGEEATGGMELIFRLLRRRFKIDFSAYKSSTVLRRTERRVAIKHHESLDDYIAQLEQDPVELDALYRDLLIGVTQFFRDRDAFRVLESSVLPELFARIPDEGECRIWVAGCATGEEAYSLTILLREHLDALRRPISAKVFATDVHLGSLEKASAGIYSPESLANVPPEWIEKYFNRVNGQYQVATELRKMVVFAPHNVIKDAPFTRLDLISCRNLLIYLKPIAQLKALSLFHFGLKTNGILVLGPSENPGDLAGEFEELDRHWRIYRKRRDIRLPTDLRPAFTAGNPVLLAEEPSGFRGRSTDAIQFELFSNLLEEMLPASVLINESREVLHSFGEVSNLLRVPRGRPSSDLLDMLSEDLKLAVASALQRAKREGKAATFSRVRSWDSGHEVSWDIKVGPVRYRRESHDYFLVAFTPSFENALPELSPAGGEQEGNLANALRERVESLEVELRFARENLQATVEELETSNEEMQATNQELLASNEELQSTNEELHSVNEELYTVNAEFQKKIDELTEVTNDINNLLISTEVHTVFLDEKLCIRKFTPRMADVFHLIPSDVGRRIDSFASKIHCENLVEKVTEVLGNGEKYEEEVTSENGDIFFMRILPYRGEGRLSGVVLTLDDVTSYRQSETRFQHLFEVAPSAKLIASEEGKILLVNQQLERMFGYDKGELLGQYVEVLMPPRFRSHHPELRSNYMSEPSIRSMGVNTTVMGLRKNGEEFPIEVRLGPLVGREGVRVVASLIDVSDRRRLEHSLREQLVQRDRFLAMLSHELRNPLAAIRYAANLLQQELGGNDFVGDPCGVICRQSEQMARLLDDLLDVSRIAQGKITLRRETIDLRGVAREGLEAVGPLLSDRNHVLDLELAEEPVWVSGDRSRLLQIFENLLTNAIKYTPEKGRIEVAIGRVGENAFLRVRDNGRGIPANQLESIFDLFSQIADSLDRGEGGMGVGLTLVQSLVAFHGGNVRAESAGPEKGSTFTVTLPCVSEGPPQPSHSSSSISPEEKARIRVVVVEDNLDACRMLRELLQIKGYHVDVAHDGTSGVELILRTRPRLALVDIGLPNLDGFQVAQQVRTRVPAEELCLIALTGYGLDSDREKVFAAGFDRHLVKPVNTEELFRSIEQCALDKNPS